MRTGPKEALESRFDTRVIPYTRALGVVVLVITVVGILFIPFWLLFSLWYAPEFLRRLSARLTQNTVEIKKGVYFRKEITIPLSRITDVHLHDDPLMRFFGIRGLKVETAGQAGQGAGTEGNLVGIIDVVEFRNAILRGREKLEEGAQQAVVPAPSPAGSGDADSVLAEIRDILARIESKG